MQNTPNQIYYYPTLISEDTNPVVHFMFASVFFIAFFVVPPVTALIFFIA